MPPRNMPFTPPPPGVSHYETLRRIEAEARKQVEASRTLSAYLASMTNTALSSSVEGGINGYQPMVQPNPTYQIYHHSQPAWVPPYQMYQCGEQTNMQ